MPNLSLVVTLLSVSMIVQILVAEVTFSNFQVQDGVYIYTHDLQLTFNY